MSGNPWNRIKGANFVLVCLFSGTLSSGGSNNLNIQWAARSHKLVWSIYLTHCISCWLLYKWITCAICQGKKYWLMFKSRAKHNWLELFIWFGRVHFDSTWMYSSKSASLCRAVATIIWLSGFCYITCCISGISKNAFIIWAISSTPTTITPNTTSAGQGAPDDNDYEWSRHIQIARAIIETRIKRKLDDI